MKLITISSLLVAGLATLLGGCTTSHVIIGHTRPPVDPATVKVYNVPPKQYEEIARIASDSRGTFAFTSDGKKHAALERAKREAASLGANGLLLQEIPHTGAMNGNWLLFKSVDTIAIYVMKE